MYDYDDSISIQRERISKNEDHCASDGRTDDLEKLIIKSQIMNPYRMNEVLTTRPLNLDINSISTESPPLYIYAVDEQYRIRIGVDGKRGALNEVKHETLFHNAPVHAAGEVYIKNGIINDINDHSGTYLTYNKFLIDPNFKIALLKAFNIINAPLSTNLFKKLN